MPSELENKAAAVIERAEESGLSIITAESCTAGALATLLADAPGAGACFHGGFVTYTKSAKQALLTIPRAVIEKCTAVSKEVAVRMAKGALKASGADVAIAVTGVAGPEPDEDGNPVGLMHIAAATRGGNVRHVKIVSDSTSCKVNRERALRDALTLLTTALSDAMRETTESEKTERPRLRPHSQTRS